MTRCVCVAQHTHTHTHTHTKSSAAASHCCRRRGRRASHVASCARAVCASVSRTQQLTTAPAWSGDVMMMTTQTATTMTTAMTLDKQRHRRRQPPPPPPLCRGALFAYARAAHRWRALVVRRAYDEAQRDASYAPNCRRGAAAAAAANTARRRHSQLALRAKK